MGKFLKKIFAAVVATLLAILPLGVLGASASPSFTQHVDKGLLALKNYSGHINWSIDGAGEPDHVKLSPQTIRFEKPDGASVLQAWLISGDGGNRNTTGHPPTDLSLNGHAVTFTHWSKITTNPGNESWNNFNTYWADVTSLVKSTIDGETAGIHTLSFDQGDGTDGDSVEGGSLIVIYNDPAAQYSSIYLKVGTSDPAGSNFTFNFPALTGENLSNDFVMSVGISNSYQASYWEQSSNIQANGQWISSVAGGCDDSTTFATTGCNFGGYNTIGGIGDTTSIPGQVDTEVTAYDRNLDKEYYRLNSFMHEGDTSLQIQTVNPSSNDNIYFAGIFLRGVEPAVTVPLAGTGSETLGWAWLAIALVSLGSSLLVMRRGARLQ